MKTVPSSELTHLNFCPFTSPRYNGKLVSALNGMCVRVRGHVCMGVRVCVLPVHPVCSGPVSVGSHGIIQSMWSLQPQAWAGSVPSGALGTLSPKE